MKYLWIILIAGMLTGTPVYAEVNVGFNTGAILFSKSTFFAGDSVKLYSVIVNNGYDLLRGDVAFYDNDVLIATVAIGDLGFEQARQVGVQWNVSAGGHIVSAKILNATVKVDGNIRPLTSSELSSLRGGTSIQSSLTVDRDTDHDGIGDSVDTDDDGDGVSDVIEVSRGTDPLSPDTDHDGVEDNKDVFPFDPKRSVVTKEDTAPAVVVPKVAPVTQSQTSPSPSYDKEGNRAVQVVPKTVVKPVVVPSRVIPAEAGIHPPATTQATSTEDVDPDMHQDDAGVTQDDNAGLQTSPSPSYDKEGNRTNPLMKALVGITGVSLLFTLYFWVKSRNDSST